jgi:hypothetical protein
MSATATSLKREADASSSTAAKRARHDSAELPADSRTAAADSCVAETEAAATQINAGIIKKLAIKVTPCSTISIHFLCALSALQHCISLH